MPHILRNDDRDSDRCARCIHDRMEEAIVVRGALGKAQVFVLGDTSYSPCCCDEVAASHLAAEVVVHFGPTCLTPTSKLPVYFVFGRRPVEALAVRDQIAIHVPEGRVVVLYDASYAHAASALKEVGRHDKKTLESNTAAQHS